MPYMPYMPAGVGYEEAKGCRTMNSLRLIGGSPETSPGYFTLEPWSLHQESMAGSGSIRFTGA